MHSSECCHYVKKGIKVGFICVYMKFKMNKNICKRKVEKVHYVPVCDTTRDFTAMVIKSYIPFS